jgi:hypothetical protein
MNLSILLISAEYIAITYIFGLLYKLIGWKNSTYIQRNLGWTGYCILGSIGITPLSAKLKYFPRIFPPSP